MLHIPSDLTSSWQELPAGARAHLVAFLSDAGALAPVVIDGALPSPFAADLAGGGHGLREAFSQLDRIVVAVDGLAIRIRCTGVHDGVFYGFLRATGRAVAF